MEFDPKYALFKLLKMVTSRAWLSLLFAGLIVSGVDIPEEWQAFIYATLAGLYAVIVYKEGQGTGAAG